ncbi:Hint domain-containing protein [Shimia biformata]|uniref:Hint domain-containing protein n=1 Tax=Shimia biformata TaxID=1294299 RepID=UPI00195095DE|nr:Hint domain-containing protein [Shimia biformata]
MEYQATAFYLGTLGDGAGKAGSSVTPIDLVFEDVGGDGEIGKKHADRDADLVNGHEISEFRHNSKMTLDDGTVMRGWYVESTDASGETHVFFVPTDGSEVTDAKLGADVLLAGLYRDEAENGTIGGGPVPCFTAGSLILTEHGLIPIEALTPGTRVLTRDNGLRPVAWVGTRHIARKDAARFAPLMPVRFTQGALGGNMPERSMMVSPNHRVLLTGGMVETVTGETEVLVAARHLLHREGISQLAPQAVTYVHILFDQHEIVLVDGAWSESFYPGVEALRGLERAQAEEVFALFPELRGRATDFGLARPALKPHEARLAA